MSQCPSALHGFKTVRIFPGLASGILGHTGGLIFLILVFVGTYKSFFVKDLFYWILIFILKKHSLNQK
jgi:hypothetical protein